MMQNVRETPWVLAAFVRNRFCSEATSSRALSQNDNSSPYHEVSFKIMVRVMIHAIGQLSG